METIYPRLCCPTCLTEFKDILFKHCVHTSNLTQSVPTGRTVSAMFMSVESHRGGHAVPPHSVAGSAGAHIASLTILHLLNCLVPFVGRAPCLLVWGNPGHRLPHKRNLRRPERIYKGVCFQAPPTPLAVNLLFAHTSVCLCIGQFTSNCLLSSSLLSL